MGAGRPCILTRELIEQVASLLPRALYIETVAGQVGITSETFREWQRLGARENRRREEGKEPDPTLNLHCEFSSTIKRVTAEAEADYLSCIQAAGSQAWTALAWILERRFPQRWATNRGELRALAKEMAKLNAAKITDAKPDRKPDPESSPTADKPHIATDPDA